MINLALYLTTSMDDSMFRNAINIMREEITPEEFASMINDFTTCFSNERMIINAMNTRYKTNVFRFHSSMPILKSGDKIVVLSCSGLPKLSYRTYYTEAEGNNAKFVFAMYSIQ